MKILQIFAAVIGAMVMAISPGHGRTVEVITPDPPAASCQNSAGDLFGDEKLASGPEIDGAELASVDQLMTQVEEMAWQGLSRAITINGGDFSGWDFSGKTLRNICFVKSNLKASKWRGTDASGMGFVGADLAGADMTEAKLRFVLLRNANLKNTNMTDADLYLGRLDGGWFESSHEGWTLAGANMSNFTFDCGITLADGCSLERDGVNIRGADLRVADFESYRLPDVTGARLTYAIVGFRDIANLASAKLDGPIRIRGGGKIVWLSQSEVTLLQEAVAAAEQGGEPSFACTMAQSATEKAICGEYESELRRLDRILAASWKAALAALPGEKAALKSSQKAWIKNRDACTGKRDQRSCLTESYWARIEELERFHADGAAPLQRGKSALFIAFPVDLDDSFLTTPLFAKIKPAFIGASHSEVIISRGDDGRYALTGGAIGANAHTCSAGGSGIYFDDNSGWYGAMLREEGEAAAPAKFLPAFQLAGKYLRIFADGRPDYQQYPDAFATCGMRASFSTMRHIELTHAELAKRQKALSDW